MKKKILQEGAGVGSKKVSPIVKVEEKGGKAKMGKSYGGGEYLSSLHPAAAV